MPKSTYLHMMMFAQQFKSPLDRSPLEDRASVFSMFVSSPQILAQSLALTRTQGTLADHDLRQSESWEWEIGFKFGANPLFGTLSFLAFSIVLQSKPDHIKGSSKDKGVTKIHSEDCCGLRSLELISYVWSSVGLFILVPHTTHRVLLSLYPSSCPQIP